jgi:hypothetical protein
VTFSIVPLSINCLSGAFLILEHPERAGGGEGSLNSSRKTARNPLFHEDIRCTPFPIDFKTNEENSKEASFEREIPVEKSL